MIGFELWRSCCDPIQKMCPMHSQNWDLGKTWAYLVSYVRAVFQTVVPSCGSEMWQNVAKCRKTGSILALTAFLMQGIDRDAEESSVDTAATCAAGGPSPSTTPLAPADPGDA